MCTVCGYTYDPALGDEEGGISPGISFDTLSGEWTCPHCGADRDDFVKSTS
ncbi:MAG: rubredoxin [Methanoregula sp.]|nr:rubredoxin [Methanoregula sp.]